MLAVFEVQYGGGSCRWTRCTACLPTLRDRQNEHRTMTLPVTGRLRRRRMPSEKRWIILTPDGGHVSIGRHTDPSEDDIKVVAQKLRMAGTGGWLAVMEGSYYGRRRVTLLMVREIVPAGGSWDTAVTAFEWTRRAATAPPRIGDAANDPT
jgi:hypothetical protein